ncbi:MAG: type II toxin-antitoxin system RelE/ParE family toxin [Deltaproteobacteria bacterium]|nr:type II toxin-antitoxin system RelE/ParE family toxin [Deltaproteobacteria bacterium]
MKIEDRKTIGEELEKGIWEVRSKISQGIARVLFTLTGNTMVLLHGFIKKSQRIPSGDLTTARQRLTTLKKE